MKKICIPLRAANQKEMLERIKNAQKEADLLELWLDGLRDPDLACLIDACSKPVIAVCKFPAEGGKFAGTRLQAAALVIEAMKNGADYLDMPMNWGEKLIKKIVHEQKKYSKCTLILSHHDFKATPSLATLWVRIQKMRQWVSLEADAKNPRALIKLVTTAKTPADSVRLMALSQDLKDKKIPHVVFAMGAAGRLSRILTPLVGSQWMFAPLTAGETTAPGQLTVEALKKAWHIIGSGSLES